MYSPSKFSKFSLNIISPTKFTNLTSIDCLLSEAGYTRENLEELRKIVHAEDSDLFDVLSYVAYHSNIIPRLDRSLKAKIHLNSYNTEQQEFLNFVLEQYVKKGVKELDKEKLAAIIELKYKTVADAKQILGDPKTTRDIFIDFQRHLYQQAI